MAYSRDMVCGTRNAAMQNLQTSTDQKRTARIEQRMSPQTKSLIEHAAALQGLTASEFMVAHCVSAARDTINRLEDTRLAADDRMSFLQAFDAKLTNDTWIGLFASYAIVS